MDKNFNHNVYSSLDYINKFLEFRSNELDKFTNSQNQNVSEFEKVLQNKIQSIIQEALNNSTLDLEKLNTTLSDYLCETITQIKERNNHHKIH